MIKYKLYFKSTFLVSDIFLPRHNNFTEPTKHKMLRSWLHKNVFEKIYSSKSSSFETKKF